MQKIFLSGIVGLTIGLIIGFFAANSINRNAVSQTNASANSQDPPFLNQQIQNATVKEQPSQSAAIPAVAATLDKANNEPNNFEAQIVAGDMYLRILNFIKAIEFYQKANQIKPGDYQTTVKIGNAYFDSGQFEEAEKWYSKALETNPKDINVRTDLGITFVERQSPDLDRAVKEFLTSLATDAKHEPTLYYLGVAYYKKGEIEKTKAVLKQLENINPQSKLAERLRQVLASKF
jgi:tetratricopeptide (TPR) repeat protein